MLESAGLAYWDKRPIPRWYWIMERITDRRSIFSDFASWQYGVDVTR